MTKKNTSCITRAQVNSRRRPDAPTPTQLSNLTAVVQAVGARCVVLDDGQVITPNQREIPAPAQAIAGAITLDQISERQRIRASHPAPLMRETLGLETRAALARTAMAEPVNLPPIPDPPMLDDSRIPDRIDSSVRLLLLILIALTCFGRGALSQIAGSALVQRLLTWGWL